MLVKVQFLVLREYYDSGLLWSSHPFVATGNAGKRHKMDLHVGYSGPLRLVYVLRDYCELRAETMPLEGRYPDLTCGKRRASYLTLSPSIVGVCPRKFRVRGFLSRSPASNGPV